MVHEWRISNWLMKSLRSQLCDDGFWAVSELGYGLDK